MRALGMAFLTAFFLFSLSIPVVADGFEVTYENVNPSDGYYKYGFKRLKEKAALFVLAVIPRKKADYYTKVINARLSELKYIVDNDDRSQIEHGSQRYFTLVGQFTEFMVENNLDSTKLKQLLEHHLVVLDDLTNKYDSTTAEWRFVKHDYDYVRIYIDRL